MRTLVPFLERSLRPLVRTETAAWSTELIDEQVGPVTLTGRFLDCGSEDVLVVVHGLGGSVESGYMGLALASAAALGKSCLLLNLRGADRQGHDVYHAGLVDDLNAALASDALRAARRIALFGYSLGGHTVLAAATRVLDPRVVRVAAIGSPLDLAASADAFDAARFSVYRGHVLGSLHEIYTAAYQRRPFGIVPVEARRIKKIREWDERVVAPRFGFKSADDYYRSVSVGPRLSDLSVPAIYVGAPADPMIPLRAVLSAAPSDRLTVAWDPDGGHLGFSAGFDLGLPGPLGLESQVLAWLFRS